VKKVRVLFTNVKAEPRITNLALYDITGTEPSSDVRNDRTRFYDGLASRQATELPEADAVQVGEWAGSPDAGWRTCTVDLTKHVTRIGQYVITFVPATGKTRPDLEFAEPAIDMYGGRVKDGVEVLASGSTFRITRSQQTLDQFPAMFHVKIRGGHPGSLWKVTIRPVLY
jgi:alpha-L-fucosidase